MNKENTINTISNNINYFTNTASKQNFNSKSFDDELNESINFAKKTDSKYEMLVEREDINLQTFEDGSIVYQGSSTSANTYFSDKLNTYRNPQKVNDLEFRSAFDTLLNEAKSILNFVINEQGDDSDLAFNLKRLYANINDIADDANSRLDKIKQMLDEKDYSLNENGEPKIIDEIFYFFNFNINYAEAFASFFNYVKDKVGGLDENKILDNLLILRNFQNKGNSSIEFADGTSTEIIHKKEGGIIFKVNGKELDLSKESQELENTKFNTLFSIFDNRENKMKENLSLKQDLNLEEKFKNTKLNTQQSPLSELLNSKDL